MFDQTRIKGKPKIDEEKIRITRKTPEKDMLRYGDYDCHGCTHCCEYGGGIVLEHEIEPMAKRLRITKEEFRKEYLDEIERFNKKVWKFKVKSRKGLPFGSCVFLEKGCKIHDVKPLYCRITTCGKLARKQLLWFDINHLVEPTDPEAIRQWAQYLQYGELIEGGELEELVPDKERLKKILSYEIFK
ncbi:YkgJ family cysteine cluster protein [Candidatus Woesearchaeota archaeon]|nr:YkgJ family cysteine cluster protein [Candidatus Woesearchaeota archaeon]